MLFAIKCVEFLASMMLLVQLLYGLFKKGTIISVKWCAYYIFNLFFVLPNFLMILYGKLNVLSYGYRFIREDWQVELVYTLFIVFSDTYLLRSARKSIKKEKFDLPKNLSLRIPIFVRVIMTIFVMSPTIMAVLAPQPELYFFSFAPFSRRDIYSISAVAETWHSTPMHISLYLAAVGIIVLWTNNERLLRRNGFAFRFFLMLIALEITLFSSKRTLGTLVFIAMALISMMFKRKKSICVFLIGFSIFYFIFYQSIVKKTVGGGVSTAMEMYIIYFSRVLDFRFVTYSLLHPEQVKILDYPCQSFLFDIFPFIRRSVWTTKPYPFGVYYTAAWNNQSIASVSYRYTVSWFSEALANLSWIGIPIGMYLYKKMLDVFNKFKNNIVRIWSIFVAIYFMITHVQSNYIFVAILIILWLVFEKKGKREVI